MLLFYLNLSYNSLSYYNFEAPIPGFRQIAFSYRGKRIEKKLGQRRARRENK